MKTQTLKHYLDQATKDYLNTLLRESVTTVEAARKAGMPESTFRDLLKRNGYTTKLDGVGGPSNEH